MSDQAWAVLDFYRRFRDGEFDGHLIETLESLSESQLKELQALVLEVGTSWKITQSG